MASLNARGERRAKRVRSSALFGADPCDLAPFYDGQGREQLRHEATQVSDSVRLRSQDDDGDHFEDADNHRQTGERGASEPGEFRRAIEKK